MPDEPCVDSSERLDATIPPGLVLVSTPIGNLGDMTLRGLAALRAADLVLAEDTRVARRLLRAFAISAHLVSLHEHNEERRIPEVMATLAAGKRVVLVADAGTPLISDPGFRLVRAAVSDGFTVSAVPGASAALMALSVSGLPPHPFMFLGFPPPRAGARRAALMRLATLEKAGLRATLIWYEAPHRLAETLADLARCFGPRQAAVARELTKRFEEMRRGQLADLAEHYRDVLARGEITIVVGPAAEKEGVAKNQTGRLAALLAGGASVREAVAEVAGEGGARRRELYRLALTLRRIRSPLT